MQKLDDQAALEGVTEGKVIWDINAENPVKLSRQLQVIARTYDDLQRQNVKPLMVFTFRGLSTTFITRDNSKFSGESLEAVELIQSTLQNLADKDGVTLEVCAIASNRMSVAPEELLEYTPLVGNTFCSLIGYQARGYALIPVY